MNHNKRTILHLGAHKTGTTFIQNWIAQNDKLFRERNIGVSRNADLTESMFSTFCFEHSKPRPKTVSPELARKNIIEIRQISGNPDVHIISKENIMGEAGRLYLHSEETIRNLKNVFNYDETKLVFYIRRMDNFIESHALQQFAHGFELNIQDAIQSIGNRTWMDVIASMEKHFPGRVSVEFYENIKTGPRDFLRYFCNACDIPFDLAEFTKLPEIIDQNRSISAPGIELLKQLWKNSDPSQRAELFKKIATTHNTATEIRPALMTPEQRHHVLDIHRESHKEIINKYAPGNDFIMKEYGL